MCGDGGGGGGVGEWERVSLQFLVQGKSDI